MGSYQKDMMKMKIVSRGYNPKDSDEFSAKNIEILKKAHTETVYLLNCGYSINHIVAFVGDHYQLSQRQRMAIMRISASSENVRCRTSKLAAPQKHTVLIDGFNILITLEVAASGSLVLRCDDGSYRDLAGRFGSYRITDKTYSAVGLVLEYLKEHMISGTICLDRKVSNSGKLCSIINDRCREINLEGCNSIVCDDTDRLVGSGDIAATSDSVILDRCNQWFNLTAEIIEKHMNNSWILTL
jgi:hypothetical protein